MKNVSKEDLRIKRTRLMLLSTFVSLLSKHSFNRITINDLCRKAMIGRSSFYSHFCDKYDLLKYLLKDICKQSTTSVCNYSINDNVKTYKNVIKNLLQDANSETYGILQDFVAEVIWACIEKKSLKIDSSRKSILSNFLTGGLLQLLLWQVQNDFPPESASFNDYIYKIMESVIECDASIILPQTAIRP